MHSFIIFYDFFKIVFIVLNMFLHLAHIYANSFNLISFAYMKMTKHESKCRFLSLIFNVSNIIRLFIFVFFLSFFFFFYHSSCRKDQFTV